LSSYSAMISMMVAPVIIPARWRIRSRKPCDFSKLEFISGICNKSSLCSCYVPDITGFC